MADFNANNNLMADSRTQNCNQKISLESRLLRVWNKAFARFQRNNDACAGKKIGDYSIIEKYSLGVMGIACKAIDSSGQEVALKKFHVGDVFSNAQMLGIFEQYKGEIIANEALVRERLQKYLEHRFDVECEILKKVRGAANIAQYVDSFTIDRGKPGETKWIATKHVNGLTLEKKIAEMCDINCVSTISGKQITEYLQGILTALIALEYNGIVHRDLHPGNVIIDAKTNKPVLLDAGLAKFAGTSDKDDCFEEMSQALSQGLRKTFGGTLQGGCPVYQAPEADKVPKSDVYSLGIMAYQIACGFNRTGFPPNSEAFAAALKAKLKEKRPDFCNEESELISVIDSMLLPLAQRPSAEESYQKLEILKLSKSWESDSGIRKKIETPATVSSSQQGIGYNCTAFVRTKTGKALLAMLVAAGITLGAGLLSKINISSNPENIPIKPSNTITYSIPYQLGVANCYYLEHILKYGQDPTQDELKKYDLLAEQIRKELKVQNNVKGSLQPVAAVSQTKPNGGINSGRINSTFANVYPLTFPSNKAARGHDLNGDNVVGLPPELAVYSSKLAKENKYSTIQKIYGVARELAFRVYRKNNPVKQKPIK